MISWCSLGKGAPPPPPRRHLILLELAKNPWPKAASLAPVVLGKGAELTPQGPKSPASLAAGSPPPGALPNLSYRCVWLAASGAQCPTHLREGRM